MIQFFRGPFTALASNVGVLAEGRPYLAGTDRLDGSYLETLFTGSHSGTNVMIGGGFQLTTGQPQFAAPAGSALVDIATSTLWASNGGSWFAISGGGGGGGSNLGTVDGGTWV